MSKINRNTHWSFQHGYLCWDCAERLGGVWPRGHLATCHTGHCALCDRTLTLAHHDDWNWPDQGFYPGRD